MTDNIHGHEVMRLMIEADKPFTRDTLKLALREKFGENTRYYTCTASGMTPDQLMDFLQQRGKFVPSDEGFTTDPDKICKH